MLDVNILCWDSTKQIWCWYNKMQFITQYAFFFDESKPTIFIKQVGDDHFEPVLSLKHKNESMLNEVLTPIHQKYENTGIIIDSSIVANRSEKDSIIIEAQIKKTNQELKDAPHQPYPYRPPNRQWLMKNCKKFGLPFRNTVFKKTEFVDDVYGWLPDETISTMGDGHCGFSSVATLITGDPKNHGILRIIIARHILGNVNTNLLFFENAKELANADLQVDANKSTDRWMRSVHLAAAADLFSCNILVKRSRSHGWTCYNSSTFRRGLQQTTYVPELPSMLLNNVADCHFEPVLTLKRID
uniref:OTU domain-containing protein n=1 Tax=Panagrolaimus superbus TaxID=310955 RepID=A0A914Y1L8_9BILA